MPFITYVGILAELIAVIIGAYFLRSVRRNLPYLYLFVCIALFFEISQHVLFRVGVTNNLWLSHLYFPIEFLFLSLLYLNRFNGFFRREWIILLIACFMLYCLVNPLFIQGIRAYSQVRSFSSIILVLFSVLYFHKVMYEATVRKLISEPMIWMNTAVLLYFSASLFHTVLFTLVLEYSREFSILTTVYFGVITIIFYLLIAVSFWKAGKLKR